MTTATYPPAIGTVSPNRMLWGAVGLLTATTLALGGTLLYQSQAKVADVPLINTTPFPAPQPKLSAVVSPVVLEEVVESKPKVLPAPVKQAEPAIKKVAKAPPQPVVVAQASRPAQTDRDWQAPAWQSPAPAREWQEAPSTPMPERRVVCEQCGVVQSVRPVQREAAGTGVGAVAGALLGGLVGNQFGGGDGKTVATMVGVLGGGLAGNTVEKRMKSQTLYQVTVRMEDGSTRTLEQTTLPQVGARVTVSGNTLSAAEQ